MSFKKRAISLFTAFTLVATMFIGTTINVSADSDWKYYEIMEWDEEAWEDVGTGEIAIERYLGSDIEVTVPNTLDGKPVVYMWDAFYDNDIVKSVDLSGALSLVEIGAGAFQGCDNLMTVKFNKDVVKTIGYSAFTDCKSLKNIELPTNPDFKTIENDLFWFCTSLKDITIPENVKTIKSGAFHDTALESIVIPNSIISLEDDVFGNCINLKSVTLPQNEYMNMVPNDCFERCSNLKEINIPDNYDRIGANAFANSGLTKLVISPKIERIGETAFWNCEKLMYLQFLGENVPTFDGTETFMFSDKLTIVVPTKAESAYNTALKEVGMPENFAVMAGDKKIEIIPEISSEYKEGFQFEGSLFEGIEIKNLGIKAEFVSSTDATVKVPGTLAWKEPDKKYEPGYYDVTWIFTPTADNALAISGSAGVTVYPNLAKPESLIATLDSDKNIQLSWYSVNDASGYEVSRKAGSGEYKVLGVTSEANYLDKDLSAGETYTYKVRAVGTVNAEMKVYSDYSDECKAYTAPSKPTIKSVKKVKKTIKVTWKKAIKGATGYQIYKSTKKSSGYKKAVAVKKQSAKSAVIKKGLKKRKTYYFKVRAYKKVGSTTLYSGFSKAKSVKFK